MKLKIGDQVRFTRNMPGWDLWPLRREGQIAIIYDDDGYDKYRIKSLDGIKDPGLWGGTPNGFDYWKLESPSSCFCNENKDFSINCLECMKKYYP